MQSVMQVSLFLLLSFAVHPVSSLSVAEGWPWSRKHSKSEAKQAETEQAPAAKQTEDALGSPSDPGCYMRMPSGCPKKPMRTALWRHDTWAEQHGLDNAACQQRKSVWDSYCDSQDAQMVYVGNETRSEPLSALQIASEWQWPWSKKRKDTEAKQTETEVKQPAAKNEDIAPASKSEDTVMDPSEPGCYMRMSSGCPKKPMRTQLWRHDTWAEQHDLDEAGCQQRKIMWDGYCDSQDAKMFYVSKNNRSEPLVALQISSEWQWPWSKKHKDTEAKKTETEAKPVEPAQAEPAQAPAAKSDDTVKDPTQSGCYMRMPSGCPKKPMRTQLWRHDTWAEQHDFDEAACQQRKSVWDGYCDSQDAMMIFVPKQ